MVHCKKQLSPTSTQTVHETWRLVLPCLHINLPDTVLKHLGTKYIYLYIPDGRTSDIVFFYLNDYFIILKCTLLNINQNMVLSMLQSWPSAISLYILFSSNFVYDLIFCHLIFVLQLVLLQSGKHVFVLSNNELCFINLYLYFPVKSLLH